MATKKTPAPKMAQSPKTPSIHARIDRINNYEGSNIRAFASVRTSAVPSQFTELKSWTPPKRDFLFPCLQTVIRTKTGTQNTMMCFMP